MEYIIKSDSYRLLKNELNKLTKDIDKDNIIYYDLSIDSLKDILNNANYVSLFDDKKAIIVYNANIFGTKYEYKEDLAILENYLDNPNKNTTLIFLTDSISLKKKCVKKIKDSGNLLDFKTLEKEDLNKEVRKYLSDIGYKIDTQALNILINRCNSNYDIILNELDKVMLIKKDYLINKGDIEKYTIDDSNINIFDFVDLIINRKTDVVLKNIDKVVEEGIEPAIIFSNVASQYRLILSVKNLLKQGLSEKDIANELSIHPYRVKLAHNNSYNYSNEELINKLLYIGNLDKKIKLGEIDKINALKVFLINI